MADLNAELIREKYDSFQDTSDHINAVRLLLNEVVSIILVRAAQHDKSKLREPEKQIFDEYTPKLKATTYGSGEYKNMLSEMQVALDHHYMNNRHHPEYFNDGISSMTLIDIVEMLCDWMAATKRHADGDIMESIKINQNRFGYSDELKQILFNTVKEVNI